LISDHRENACCNRAVDTRQVLSPALGVAAQRVPHPPPDGWFLWCTALNVRKLKSAATYPTPAVSPTRTAVQAPPAISPTPTPRNLRNITKLRRDTHRERGDRCSLCGSRNSGENQARCRHRKYCPQHVSLPALWAYTHLAVVVRQKTLDFIGTRGATNRSATGKRPGSSVMLGIASLAWLGVNRPTRTTRKSIAISQGRAMGNAQQAKHARRLCRMVGFSVPEEIGKLDRLKIAAS
jgi:hypothetical protein